MSHFNLTEPLYIHVSDGEGSIVNVISQFSGTMTGARCSGASISMH
jgi:hypothetical protein